jgi:predicted nucleic acid-binding protein
LIALDTSSLIAFFAGDRGEDLEAVDAALRTRQAVLPPVVLAEFLSAPSIPESVASGLAELPLLEIQEGYWTRTGKLRSRLRAMGRKARLADALIAQSCLDHKAPLVTRDREFRHFARHCGLQVLPGLDYRPRR